MKIKFYYFIIFFCPFFRVNQFCKAEEYPILETIEQYEIEICKKFSDKIKGYYNNKKKYKFKDDEIKNVSSKYFDDLFRIINFDSSFGKYNKHLKKHYFFISLGIFILFIWFIYNIILIFQKFPHLVFTKKYSKFILFITISVLYLTIFILSVIGAVNTSKIKNNIDEIKCYFVLFGENYKKGNKIYKNNEYWNGELNIIQNMSYLNKSLYKINNIVNSILNNNNFEIFDDFSNAINDSFTNDIDELINYNFQIEDIDKGYITLLPEYSKNWKEYLNLLNKTLNDLIDINIKEILHNISDYYQYINNSFTNIKIILKNTTNITDSLYISTLEPWLNYQEEKYKKNNIVLIIFIVLSIFCLSIIILEIFFFYSNLNESSIKIIFHVIWNLLNFLLIPTFIFGGIYGIYGTIAKDYSVVINEIFCQENLNNIYNRIYPKYHNLTTFYNILYRNNINFNDILTYVNNIISYKTELNNSFDNFSSLYNNISNMNNLLVFYYKNKFYYSNSETKTYNLSETLERINNYTTFNNIRNGSCSSWINETWINESYFYNKSDSWAYEWIEKTNEDSNNNCNKSEVEPNKSCNINLYTINKYNIPRRYEYIEIVIDCEKKYDDLNFHTIYASSEYYYLYIFEKFLKNTINSTIKEKQKNISSNFKIIDSIFNGSITNLYKNIDLLSNNYTKIYSNINDKATNINYLRKHIKIMIENLNNGYGNRYIRIENIFISIGFILLITQIISIFAINNEQSITYYDKNK